MSPELDEKLCQKYPLIFKDRTLNDDRATLMCYGFCHGDGWYDIIDNLCEGIQTYCDEKKTDGDPEFQVVAVQVKEKFGGLRFYVDGGDDYIYKLISTAEKESCKTCEDCGAPGKLDTAGWWSTTCEPCLQKRNEYRKNR